MQQAAIRELSTPIIEVWAGVLCLPVVGIVDSQRSAEMTETLLETIVAKQARMAIVDITGIDVMDTKTADHFIKMARAVRLLGAECIVSGINPGIAQTLTHIGVDLTGVRTLRSLRDALQLYLRETEQLVVQQGSHFTRRCQPRSSSGAPGALPGALGRGPAAGKAFAIRGRSDVVSVSSHAGRLARCASAWTPGAPRSWRSSSPSWPRTSSSTASGARSVLTLDPDAPPRGEITVEAHDVGPPIHDLQLAMTDGNDDRGPIDPALILRRGGLGTGLGAVARLADRIEYREEEGGKTITARFFRK